MQRAMIRLSALAILAAMLIAGCDKPRDEVQPAKPAAAESTQSGSTTVGDTARPSLSGAKGAAEHTVDRVNRYQHEVEKQIEE